MRTLVRGKYRHTGYAFVTFNKAAVAREVVRRLTKGGTDEQRLESVLVRTRHTGAVCSAPPPPMHSLCRGVILGPTWLFLLGGTRRSLSSSFPRLSPCISCRRPPVSSRYLKEVAAAQPLRLLVVFLDLAITPSGLAILSVIQPPLNVSHSPRSALLASQPPIPSTPTLTRSGRAHSRQTCA